jgi:hypothetical protein|tara:strand:+ start:89 stop:667 length:579 start_codon:yes stop_codon:yes gene_type:complete
MANQQGNFGFRPVLMLGSAYQGQGQQQMTIASNETNSIFMGDPVVLNANGSISRGSSKGAELVGVFNGCFYTDPTSQKPTFSNHYPGGIVASDIVASVISDPDVVFEVKVDDANAGRAQVGSTANIATYAAGSTKSGISGVSIDGGSFATSNGSNFAVYDLSTDPDNSDYTVANANILVRINLHQYRDSTGV